MVGAGVFGLTAAVELRRRGHAVALFDPGPLPRPEASSTDYSRAVRADYGDDSFYCDLAESTFAPWREWNSPGQDQVFYPDGFLLLCRRPMSEGGFELQSYRTLLRRGYPLERLDAAGIARRFPVLAQSGHVDGYHNPRGGWVDASAASSRLLRQARDAGVEVSDGVACTALLERAGAVVGIVTSTGAEHSADDVVVTAGAWTPVLLPWLRDRLTPTAQPVFYFEVPDPARFRAPGFAPFGSDISTTGWYGFPAARNDALKIANHGPGIALSPDAPRRVPAEFEAAAREFLRTVFPAIADAPVLERKLCFYCDSHDGDFLIDHDPDRPGLVVAAGGSGHGFKFAPILGDLIANVVERRSDVRARRFAWRESGPTRAEQARMR